jgi:hypothetical protein
MLLLWLILNAVFVWQVIQAARAAQDSRPLLVQLLAVDFVLWLAAFINMSFDVYLEGPQGGIWFWTSIGFGAWLVRAVRQGIDLEDPDEAAEPVAPSRLAGARGRAKLRAGFRATTSG